MVFHTITNVQLNKPCQLQNYIDNRDGNKTVGLKSITYWVGWFNITGNQSFSTRNKQFDLEPGLYNFNDLKNIFSDEGIDLSVNKINGIITLDIPSGTDVQLSPGILSLLGIVSKHGLLTAGQHIGDKIIDFAKPKELRIYLNEISTSTNFIDGAPSSLLSIIPVSDKPFGKAVSYQLEFPVFKHLVNGCITELSIHITDENNKFLNNNGLPINIELIIQ